MTEQISIKQERPQTCVCVCVNVCFSVRSLKQRTYSFQRRHQGGWNFDDAGSGKGKTQSVCVCVCV